MELVEQEWALVWDKWGQARAWLQKVHLVTCISISRTVKELRAALDQTRTLITLCRVLARSSSYQCNMRRIKLNRGANNKTNLCRLLEEVISMVQEVELELALDN